MLLKKYIRVIYFGETFTDKEARTSKHQTMASETKQKQPGDETARTTTTPLRELIQTCMNLGPGPSLMLLHPGPHWRSHESHVLRKGLGEAQEQGQVIHVDCHAQTFPVWTQETTTLHFAAFVQCARCHTPNVEQSFVLLGREQKRQETATVECTTCQRVWYCAAECKTQHESTHARVCAKLASLPPNMPVWVASTDLPATPLVQCIHRIATHSLQGEAIVSCFREYFSEDEDVKKVRSSLIAPLWMYVRHALKQDSALVVLGKDDTIDCLKGASERKSGRCGRCGTASFGRCMVCLYPCCHVCDRTQHEAVCAKMAQPVLSMLLSDTCQFLPPRPTD